MRSVFLMQAAGDRKLNLSLDASVGKTDQQLEDALIKAWNNEIESRRYIMDDVRTRLEVTQDKNYFLQLIE